MADKRDRLALAVEIPHELQQALVEPQLVGPIAAVVTMTARNRISRRDMSELARDLFGIVLSVGTVDQICRRASQALAEPARRTEDLRRGRGALTGRLFKAWRAFDAHQDRRRLKRETKPIQTGLRALLKRAARKSKRTLHHGRFARNLLKIWPAPFTFLTVAAVEPTNSAAERSLRGPVIHRKLSHGTRTDDGERFVERALSASGTCRLQGRSLYTHLSELLAANARGDPLPTLT